MGRRIIANFRSPMLFPLIYSGGTWTIKVVHNKGCLMKTVYTALSLCLMLLCIGCATPSYERSTIAENRAMPKPSYIINYTHSASELQGNWDSLVWRQANILEVDTFFQDMVNKTMPSEHRPRTRAKVLYDDKGLYVHFRVDDKYVRSIETEYHGIVWEDATVEFFVQPQPDRGYFNFEINCGGTMLLSYKEHPDFSGEALRKTGEVPWDLAKTVQIYHSMPKTVDPEITQSVTWYVEYFIPYALFEAYLGPLDTTYNAQWRANFYKCAENNSHPHWAMWSPIHSGLNFHQPQYFAPIKFGLRD